MKNSDSSPSDRPWPTTSTAGFPPRNGDRFRNAPPQVIAQTPLPNVIPTAVVRDAEKIVQEIVFLGRMHAVDSFSPKHAQRSLRQDFAVALNANPHCQIVLDLLDTKGKSVVHAVWTNDQDGPNYERSPGTSRDAVTRFELRLRAFSSRQLVLEASRLHCRWRRSASQAAPSSPKGSVGPNDRSATGAGYRRQLRIHRTGTRGFAFAETTDGERLSNVYCNLDEAPGIDHFRIGDTLSAYLTFNRRGVQARRIRYV